MPFATGAAPFFDRIDNDNGRSRREPRIYLHVRPIQGGAPILAMVDTAAPWCILRPEAGKGFRPYLEDLETRRLDTRLGTFRGMLSRGSVRIMAHEGEPLEVEALIFLSPDWSGPNIIGYEGMLEKVRFAVDPGRNLFYFGEVGG